MPRIAFISDPAAILALLAVYPDGRYQRSYERRLVRGACALAVAVPLGLLLSQARLEPAAILQWAEGSVIEPSSEHGDQLRIVIADDHYLVREGARQLLEDSGEVDVVAAVGTATELLSEVKRLRPDAVISDIRMPPGHHMEGIEAARRIRAEHPDVGVVILSQHAEEGYAYELLKDGADGRAYLLKDRVGDLQELLHALREVVAGRSAIDARVVEALVARRARLTESGLEDLTPRELDVLRLMAQGKTNAGAAAELVLSESAIEKHVGSIFAKLGLIGEQHVHRRVAAVLTFLREGDSSERQARGAARAPAGRAPQPGSQSRSAARAPAGRAPQPGSQSSSR